MHRSSYTRELGLEAHDKVVPWPYVAILFALVAVGVWRGAGQLQARMDERHESERLSAAAEAPVRATLARK